MMSGSRTEHSDACGMGRIVDDISASEVQMNQLETPFLTFLIITYRRPAKLCRLLSQFLDDRWSEVMHLGLEIVVADDHSEDASRDEARPILDALRDKGWRVYYCYREQNLRGDRNLYYGYTRDSRGDYVWLLCDDDQLVVDEAVRLVGLIHDQKPQVCVCGFAQGDLTVPANRLGTETRIIHDFPEAVSFLGQYPKTSAYILRRMPSLDLDVHFERWDRSLYSWIGMSIYLFGKHPERGLMLYPSIAATADDDYGVLRYSYRVFGKLQKVVMEGVQAAGADYDELSRRITGNPHFCQKDYQDEVLMCILGLRAHYNWKSHIEYNEQVLTQELEYLKRNLLRVLGNPRTSYHFIKMLIVKWVDQLKRRALAIMR